MDRQELQSRASGVLLRCGPPFMRLFLIYAGLLAVLNLLSLLLEARLYTWVKTCADHIAAGDLTLPPVSANLRNSTVLSLLLILLGKALTARWIAASLSACQGGTPVWRELSPTLSQLWKSVAITLLAGCACFAGFYLLIFPGLYLLYGWRLSYFVLAEHPEYSPIQCLRRSRELMKGNRLQLLKLDAACLLPYLAAITSYSLTSGVLSLWRSPSIVLLQSVFYLKLSGWKEPEEAAHGE